jgi:hypothetical protein
MCFRHRLTCPAFSEPEDMSIRQGMIRIHGIELE